METEPAKNLSVFINYPFGKNYQHIFRAIVFAVIDCGYRAICAEEIINAGVDRLQKISDLILSCRFGIHDISMVALDKITKLPRFNMPFELGFFLGAAAAARAEEDKKFCLIFAHHAYDYRKCLSDISGHDIYVHDSNARKAIELVRDFLLPHNKDIVPGTMTILEHYQKFQKQFPVLCRDLGLNPENLIFNDYANLVSRWLELNAPPSK